jgi:type II secretory pathway pseudopilin PulG
MRKRRRGQEGVTLLEALMTISLFAIVSTAAATLAVGSVRSTSLTRHAAEAAMLAQWQMEQVRGLDYPSMASTTTSATMGGQYFTIATNVQADTPAANMKDIVVTVSWTGPEGTRSYSTESIYVDITL